MPRILKINPFRPGKPLTDPELFAGRREELEFLVDALFQTGNKNASHTIVTGARGIGKSSLVNQIDRLVKGDVSLLKELDIDPGSFKFKFHICKHKAIKEQATSEIVTSLMAQTQEVLDEQNFKNEISEFINKFKFKVKIPFLEAEYQSKENLTSDLSTEFLKVIQKFLAATSDKLDGLILIIDEVDTIADGDIASFCKITTEALVDRGIEQVAFILVGISGAMEKLKRDHQSVSRIFRTIEVLPMTDDEASDIVRRATKKANVNITDQVINNIINLSSGYPSPVHLLGYHAFDEDINYFIEEDDFKKGLDKVVSFVKREELSAICQQAGSGNYRRIVEAMAEYDEDIVPLKYLADLIGRNSSAMSSYMNALIERGIVERIDRAQYKILEPLLKIYIRKFGIFPESHHQPDEQLSLFDSDV